MADVYIAGSLRHTPQEWWKIYEKIGNIVKNLGMNVHTPHIDTVKDVNAHVEDIHDPNLDLSVRSAVYKRNLEVIKNSKLIIAEVSNPSTGTGVEIGFALMFNKPIICLAHEGVDVTSMVLGPVKLGLIDLIKYKEEGEALNKLEKLLLDKFRHLISKR